MKIETKTKITITLDENEYTLTRSEAQELYNKLKKELGITDTLPYYLPKENSRPPDDWAEIPLYPMHPPFPSHPQVWCSTTADK